MSAVIAYQCARRGLEQRKERAAEREAEDKLVADAEKALRKLQAASSVQELTDAVRRGQKLKWYLPELEEALPAARERLRSMGAAEEELDADAFQSLFEDETARHDEEEASRVAADRPRRASVAVLDSFYEDMFSENDAESNGLCARRALQP